MPVKIDLDRTEFELFVGQNKLTVAELKQKIHAGEISDNQWVFTLDQVIACCDKAATGAWYKAASSRWLRQKCRPWIRKVISEAFTSK